MKSNLTNRADLELIASARIQHETTSPPKPRPRRFCAACGQRVEFFAPVDKAGYWYHLNSGLRGWVDDPTGTDAAHVAILASEA